MYMSNEKYNMTNFWNLASNQVTIGIKQKNEGMDGRNGMSTYLITMIWVVSNIVDFCMMFPFITI